MAHNDARSPDSQETDTSQYLSGQIDFEEYRRRLEKSTPPATALQRSMVENRNFVRQVATWLRQDEESTSSPQDAASSVASHER